MKSPWAYKYLSHYDIYGSSYNRNKQKVEKQQQYKTLYKHCRPTVVVLRCWPVYGQGYFGFVLVQWEEEE